MVFKYFVNKNQASEEFKVLPPFIFVFDELYQGGVQFKTQEEFNNLKPKLVEVGSIKSKVSVKEIPSINFQSNSAPIGSLLYSNGNILYCKDVDAKYWIYEIKN
jgi:hypothetical protein